MENTKNAERKNVLLESENKNFVHAVLNAVTRGYSDKIVVDDILELVRSKEVSKGVLTAAPEALREYARSFYNSLTYIADEIENVEIIDELQVIRKQREKKQQEDVESHFGDVENDKVFEDDEEHSMEEAAADGDKLSEKPVEDIVVNEDMERYTYNESMNKISGILQFTMNKDVTNLKNANKVNLDKPTIEQLTKAAFAYLKKEYPKLKAALTDNVFKGNLVFKDLKTGSAEIPYEIEGAY
jgi:hypothetical protein